MSQKKPESAVDAVQWGSWVWKRQSTTTDLFFQLSLDTQAEEAT